MVCDTPRQRQLPIRRRGSFFEDPFFRDARPDYSLAVRRIVNRFNRGFVNTSTRIRDSQYHSMYRSLRTARQNFSAHTSRFKEEGDAYKLMMDVGEFVGGNITVRTAGGTVSVRGKVDLDPEETAKRSFNDDDDDQSSISGCSSTSKTLHRRFNLPVDADGGKVESSLSRDAVLSIVIPKRKDIHYIPVEIEGKENKDHVNIQTDCNRPSRKRPNDSHHEMNGKKIDGDELNRRRKRLMREETMGNEEDMNELSDKNLQRSQVDKNTEGSGRNREYGTEYNNGMSERSRSRKRENKYEEAKEINIPIQIKYLGAKGKTFLPINISKDVINENGNELEGKFQYGESCGGEIGENGHSGSVEKDNLNGGSHESDNHERNNTNGLNGHIIIDKDNREMKYINKSPGEKVCHETSLNQELVNKKKEQQRTKKQSVSSMSSSSSSENSSNSSRSSSPVNGIDARREVQESVITADGSEKEQNGFVDLNKFNYFNNEEKKSPGVIINDKATTDEEHDDDDDGDDNDENEDSDAESSDEDRGYEKDEDESDKLIVEDVTDDVFDEEQNYVKMFNVPEDSVDTKSSNICIINEPPPIEENIKDDQTLEVSKELLETPKMSRRSSSPLTPGSQSVKVQDDDSMMEDGMFKDCWYDFSNTLQDVLVRLQELSSELEPSKALETSPTVEELPSLPQETADLDSVIPSKPNNNSEVTLPCSECAHAPQENETSTHKEFCIVGGVGRRGGGIVDENSASHSDVVSGHGQDVDESDVLSMPVSAISDPQTVVPENSRKSSILTETDLDTPSGRVLNEDQCLWGTNRPTSLALKTEVSQNSTTYPETENSDSFSFIENAPGALLDSLRKDSPVEALQKDFFRKSKSSEPYNANESFSISDKSHELEAVPVSGLQKKEQRSFSLSSSKSQLDDDCDRSELESVTSDALDNVISEYSEGADVANTISSSSSIWNSHPNVKNLVNKNKNSSDIDLYNKNLDVKSLKNGSNRGVVHNYFTDESSDTNLPDEIGKYSSSESCETKRFPFRVKDIIITEPLPSSLSSEELFTTTPSGIDVINNSDVTEATTLAKKYQPEIPSNDAMVCERPFVNDARLPYRGAKDECSRFSRINRPRDLNLSEPYGDASRGFAAKDAMGGVFSREKKAPSRAGSESLSSTPSRKSPSEYTSPSGRGLRYKFPPEEKPLPPYVRVRPEPTKRTSGFSHVNSDNVRRMRDVWGPSKQESKSVPLYQQSQHHRVSPSPTRISKRTSYDINDGSNSSNPKYQSPRVSRADEYISPKDWASTLRTSSPSPNRRGYNYSPSYKKPTSEKTVGRDSPSRTNGTYSKLPYYDYLRRESQGSHGRGSPVPSVPSVPSSPCRRCSRGRSESPLPSPSLDRKARHDSFSKLSERTRSSSRPNSRPSTRPSSKPSSIPSSRQSSRASSIEKEIPRRGTPPRVIPSRASKAHQKIFKRLRDSNLLPESEAICFKEGEERYTMVLDVEEFVPGEVEVLQDDHLLTVKGRVEVRGSLGHISVRTFHRTFDIPKNSREEDIDSALSNDGILTIFVPKKRERVIKIELID